MSRALELARRTLPPATVLRVAIACGLPEGTQAREFGGKAWKVEVFSNWGWNTHFYPAKVAKAREIADALEREGICCAFDVLDTAAFDAVFEKV